MHDSDLIKDTLILCAGYLYGGDMAFGAHVANALQANGLPDHVECYEVGESISETFIDHRKKIIVVDTLKTGDPPGTIYRLQPEEVIELSGGSVDAPKYHMLQAVYALRMTGDCDEAVFIGIVPKETEALSGKLTPEIAATIPVVIDMIMEEVQ